MLLTLVQTYDVLERVVVRVPGLKVLVRAGRVHRREARLVRGARRPAAALPAYPSWALASYPELQTARPSSRSPRCSARSAAACRTTSAT
jgi:hypothetical protein